MVFGRRQVRIPRPGKIPYRTQTPQMQDTVRWICVSPYPIPGK